MTPNSASIEHPIISRVKLADRWECCDKTVYKRVKAWGIKEIRLGHKSIFYRLADIVKAEEARCR